MLQTVTVTVTVLQTVTVKRLCYRNEMHIFALKKHIKIVDKYFNKMCDTCNFDSNNDKVKRGKH